MCIRDRGKAAGLTNDQLVALGKGAKDASLILGRDVTDSFNRLVRGVTKAEPELLDELGIILRLNDASEKYGAIIGKNAQDLTQFEKSQAVTNDVLDQLESKYGAIMAAVEPSGNAFTKLGKAFDDIVNQIKEIALVIAGPVAQVLTRTPALAIGLLLSFGNTLIKTGLASWTENASTKAELLKADYEEARLALEKLQNAQGKGVGSLKGGTAAFGKLEGMAAGKGVGFDPRFEKFKAFQSIKSGDIDKLTSRQLAAMKRSVATMGGLDKQMRNSWISALDAMLAKTKLTAKGQEKAFQESQAKINLGWQKTRLTFQGIMTSMSTAAAAAGRVITMALSAVTWVSLLVTLGTTIYQLSLIQI